jgi:hypothetical protein
VFLKITSMKGVMRLGKKGRLAYRVALPLGLARTHDVFHVSMLRKYIANLDLVVNYEIWRSRKD